MSPNSLLSPSNPCILLSKRQMQSFKERLQTLGWVSEFLMGGKTSILINFSIEKQFCYLITSFFFLMMMLEFNEIFK